MLYLAFNRSLKCYFIVFIKLILQEHNFEKFLTFIETDFISYAASLFFHDAWHRRYIVNWLEIVQNDAPRGCLLMAFHPGEPETKECWRSEPLCKSYSWIDYIMRLKHNVDNRVSAACQNYSVTDASKVCFSIRVDVAWNKCNKRAINLHNSL